VEPINQEQVGRTFLCGFWKDGSKLGWLKQRLQAWDDQQTAALIFFQMLCSLKGREKRPWSYPPLPPLGCESKATSFLQTVRQLQGCQFLRPIAFHKISPADMRHGFHFTTKPLHLL
jgi:hypothetical protein